MSGLTDLLKQTQSRASISDADAQRFGEILASFWFDTPAIIGTATESDLTRIKIPSDIAALLIEEAKKLLDASNKSYKGYESYKNHKPYVKRNYQISDDLAVSGTKNDMALETYNSSDPVDTPPYVKYFRIFMGSEKNIDTQKRSLKKIKHILAKIIQAPEMKEWRVLDPDSVEIHKLIMQYQSLCKVLQVLGFKVNTKSRLELKPSDVNIELLQSCQEHIQKLLKPQTSELALDEPTVTFGPSEEIETQEKRELLQASYEQLINSYQEYVLPRVRILETKEEQESAIESRRKLFEDMVHRRKRNQESLEKDIREHEAVLNEGDTFLEEFQRQKLRQDLKEKREKLERLVSELSGLGDHLKALPKAKNMKRRASLGPDTKMETEKPMDKEYAKGEYKKRLRKTFPDTDFPADPLQDPVKLTEFEKIQAELEDYEGKIREEIYNDSDMMQLFTKIKCYATDDRTVLTIVDDDLPLLEIDLSKGETVQTVFDLIGFKLGLLESAYVLSFKGTSKDIEAMGKDAMLKELSVDFYEVLELEMINKGNEGKSSLFERFQKYID